MTGYPYSERAETRAKKVVFRGRRSITVPPRPAYMVIGLAPY